ncbi:MAG: hypothetical protein PVJ21_06330 [Anaerolineales bacterium]|jgi:hypothetical protein
MQLKAFVGHSFNQNDKPIIDEFLDFLNHVASMGIQFTWDHAEWAEPKELSHKVKEKMKGKNVFIGICTSREQVVVNENLTPVPFFHQFLKARQDNFITKTSDWIIQEIGFAVGQDMSIIILLESGIRRPGGLQGDI